MWKNRKGLENPGKTVLENRVDKYGKPRWVVHVIHIFGETALVIHIFSTPIPQEFVEKLPIISTST